MSLNTVQVSSRTGKLHLHVQFIVQVCVAATPPPGYNHVVHVKSSSAAFPQSSQKGRKVPESVQESQQQLFVCFWFCQTSCDALCTEPTQNIHQDGSISPLLTCSHEILVLADSASIRLMIFFIFFLANAVDLCLCAPQTAATETCFDSHHHVLLGATLESALTAVLYKTGILIRCSGSSFRTILANQNIFFSPHSSPPLLLHSGNP